MRIRILFFQFICSSMNPLSHLSDADTDGKEYQQYYEIVYGSWGIQCLPAHVYKHLGGLMEISWRVQGTAIWNWSNWTDVTDSQVHPSSCVFLLILYGACRTFAFPSSQIEMGIVKLGHHSDVGSSSQKKVLFAIKRSHLSLLSLTLPRSFGNYFRS